MSVCPGPGFGSYGRGEPTENATCRSELSYEKNGSVAA
jgi:hypothetical protein